MSHSPHSRPHPEASVHRDGHEGGGCERAPAQLVERDHVVDRHRQGPGLASGEHALIVTLPVLVLTVFAQRQIVAGLTAGAVKGG
jgi:hypothetical protein